MEFIKGSIISKFKIFFIIFQIFIKIFINSGVQVINKYNKSFQIFYNNNKAKQINQKKLTKGNSLERILVTYYLNKEFISKRKKTQIADEITNKVISYLN